MEDLTKTITYYYIQDSSMFETVKTETISLNIVN